MVDCSNRMPALFTSARSGSPFTIEAVKHRQHLRFIADIRAHGKRFTARFTIVLDHFGGGVNVVMIIHRDGIAFVRQLQRRGSPMPRLAPLTSAIAIRFSPINKAGGIAFNSLRYYISNITGIRSSARRSRTGYGRRRRHPDASPSASTCCATPAGNTASSREYR